DRRPARNPGSFDHEDDCPRADARLGDRPAHPADFRRFAACAAGFALSCAAPPRAPGLDRGRLGRVGEQSSRPLLLADQGRSQAARRRSLQVGAPFGRRQPRPAPGLTVRLWDILRTRLRSLLFRDSRESELTEELQLHLERETGRPRAGGLSPDAASLQARRTFGGVEQIREECRDARGTAFIDDTVRDIVYALRTFKRTPLVAFTI